MTQNTASSNPFVFSVIVPTHFRPAHLLRCLRGLAALDYPRTSYEVIVVDDGGSLESTQFSEFSPPADLSLQFLSQAQGGPALARNAGAARARGTYLAFTDDDCVPTPEWLTALERRLAAHPRSIVGGLTENASEAKYSAASQMLLDYLYDYYHVEVTGARFFTTNNLALRADAFRDIGGFDRGFPMAAGEDREFCERWQRNGGELVYAEEARVHHFHKLSFRTFLRQHFTYGRGADLLHQSRARHEHVERRPKLEPPKFYLNLLRYPFTRSLDWKALPMVGLMFLSQAAYGTGYLFQRLRRVSRSRGPDSLP